jgi:hypothetical protein
MTENFYHQREETWNVVDREVEGNAYWRKKKAWARNRLQVQVLLVHLSCI